MADVLDWLLEDEEGEQGTVLEAYTDEQIETHLRQLGYNQERLKVLEDQYNTEATKLKHKFDVAAISYQKSILHHTTNLVESAKQRGKSFKGINGTVKKVSGRDSVKCETPEEQAKFFAWCAETGNAGLIRVTPEVRAPQKPAIAKFIKENGGELPPGIDFETGPDTFNVKAS